MASVPMAHKSLQIALSGAGSPRSASPARPSSPRFASPARTPRSNSPQHASFRARAGADDLAAAHGPERSAASSPSLGMGSPLGSPRLMSRPSSLLSDARPATPLRVTSGLARSSMPGSPTPVSRAAGTAIPAASSILSSVQAALAACAPPPTPSTPPQAAAGMAAGAPSDTAPASPNTLHKQAVKLLARVGMDSCRAALLLQSPVDGIANELAYTASEMLLQKVGTPTTPSPTATRSRSEPGAALTASGQDSVAGTAAADNADAQDAQQGALSGGPCPAASPAAPASVNPYHVNVMTVVVSTLLSTAAHGAVDAAMAAVAPAAAAATSAPTEVSRSAVPDMSPAERLAMRLSSVSIAAALAKAPPLRAADAEDAFGVGLATTIGVKMMMNPGSAGVAPEVGGVLEGILSAVHDSVDGLELPPVTALLQAPMAGPWAGHAALLNIPNPQL